MIEVKNVVKRFDGFAALSGATLTVPTGSVYGLVGPNGAGKSTIIRHLTGIYRQDEGSVSINGQEIEDILDYHFLSEDEYLEILIRKADGEKWLLEVEKDGTLRLQAGIMKTAAKQEDVRLVENEPSNSSVKRIIKESKVKLPPRASAAPSVDLRGMTITEAIDEVENFLDTAMLANLDVVTIIHGKGTGALRAAVQQHLKTMKSVKSFRPGRYGEGEDGVTVVELK